VSALKREPLKERGRRHLRSGERVAWLGLKLSA
jgi:hypothetical protein